MDLTGVLTSFSDGSVYTVTRTAKRTIDANGRATAPSTSTLTVRDAVVTPLSGRDRQALPEGARGHETRLFLSPVALQTTTATTEADSIAIDGAAWLVITCEPWALGSYWRAVVQRVGVLG